MGVRLLLAPAGIVVASHDRRESVAVGSRGYRGAARVLFPRCGCHPNEVIITRERMNSSRAFFIIRPIFSTKNGIGI